MPVIPVSKADIENQVKGRAFPDFVIQSFNECIYEARVKKNNNVYQNDVIERIVALGGVSRNEVFANNWLDVEDTYRAQGWKVSFFKPAYNERGDAYFTFS